MGRGHQHIAAASLSAAAVVVVPFFLWAIHRKNRAGGTVVVHPPGKLNKDVTREAGAAAAATDRRPPEDEQVFSLYGSGEGEREPSVPPMELSKCVLALLDSFDVDPVRGKCVVEKVIHIYNSWA